MARRASCGLLVDWKSDRVITTATTTVGNDEWFQPGGRAKVEVNGWIESNFSNATTGAVVEAGRAAGRERRAFGYMLRVSESGRFREWR